MNRQQDQGHRFEPGGEQRNLFFALLEFVSKRFELAQLVPNFYSFSWEKNELAQEVKKPHRLLLPHVLSETNQQDVIL